MHVSLKYRDKWSVALLLSVRTVRLLYCFYHIHNFKTGLPLFCDTCNSKQTCYVHSVLIWTTAQESGDLYTHVRLIQQFVTLGVLYLHM